MSVVDKIKSSATLYDVATLIGIQFPSHVGCKFRSPFRPDTNPSCSLYERNGQLRFCDWSNEIDVDLIGLYALARGISNADAIPELARELRIDCRDHIPHASRIPTKHNLSEPGPNQLAPFRPMPQPIADAWIDGCRYLCERLALQERIAAWRGWTRDVVGQLANDGMMGTPLFRGERLIAFRVDYPLMKDFGAFGKWFSTSQIGWHVRLKARPNERAEWRFVPNAAEHGHSTPALPFVLGDFQSARLLIITEGQWDAVSVAHAAGWLSHDAAWPDSICVLGIRGVQGASPFLQYYAPLWSEKPKCLLLPDGDRAGTRWFEERPDHPSFAEQLRKHCAEVRVQTLKGAKDFNEAWKRGLVTQSDIAREFQSNGFVDGRGRLL